MTGTHWARRLTLRWSVVVKPSRNGRGFVVTPATPFGPVGALAMLKQAGWMFERRKSVKDGGDRPNSTGRRP